MSKNRKESLLSSVKDKMIVLTAKLTGNGTNALVNAESANLGAGEITPGARTGTGAHTLALNTVGYPELKAMGQPCVVGTTDGLQCKVLTWDVTAGTATIQLEVGTVATDAATTDAIHFTWIVRNSGRNK